MIQYFLILLLIAFSVSCNSPEKDSYPGSKADSSDNPKIESPVNVDSVYGGERAIDSVILSLYESISFEKGRMPDLQKFISLVDDDARLIRAGGNRVVRMNPDEFISAFEKNIESGKISSFREEEIARQINAFGKVVHAFSVYKTIMETEDSVITRRGINSIQLFYENGRWRISGILWDDERLDNPIPERYLN